MLILVQIKFLVSKTKSKLTNNPADNNELRINKNLYFFVPSATAPNTAEPINPQIRNSAPKRLLLSLEFSKP